MFISVIDLLFFVGLLIFVCFFSRILSYSCTTCFDSHVWPFAAVCFVGVARVCCHPIIQYVLLCSSLFSEHINTAVDDEAVISRVEHGYGYGVGSADPWQHCTALVPPLMCTGQYILLYYIVTSCIIV